MENNGNDIFDPIDSDTGTNTGGYVPRFERDLQKMGGNLNALADAKKAEQQAEKAAPVQEEQLAEEPEANENDEEIYDNVTETPASDEPVYSASPYHSAAVEEDSYDDDDGYRRRAYP